MPTFLKMKHETPTFPIVFLQLKLVDDTAGKQPYHLNLKYKFFSLEKTQMIGSPKGLPE